MVDSLAILHQWLAERHWSDNTHYNADDECSEFETGLVIDGIRYGLKVMITDQPLWASVKLSPLFIINGVQLDHVDAIVEAANGQLQGANFRTYSRDGYGRLRYRASAPLDDGLHTTETISRIVDGGIATCGFWVPRLRAVATSSRAFDASSMHEMLADQPASAVPIVQQIISGAEFERRWQLFLDERPSPARSMAAHHGWIAQQEAQFQEMLAKQGVLTDR